MVRKISEQAAIDFAVKILCAAGVAQEASVIIAESLVWAESRGLGSHGLQRLEDYTDRVESGLVVGGAEPKVVRMSGATAVVNGERGQGQPAFSLGAETAVGLAREFGVGWVAVGNCSHAGALGFFTHRIAERGLIGLGVISSKPNMGYPGARGALVGTNPIAIAVPVEGEVVSVDLSPASITRGQLKQHRREGTPLPEGVALTADGMSTTDAELANTVMPIGGAKGGVLALAFEFLAGILAGFPVLAPSIARDGAAPLQGGSLVAVDFERFSDSAQFEGLAIELVKVIRSADSTSASVPVRMPGERSAELAKRSKAYGLTLDKLLVAQLDSLAHRLGVAVIDGDRP